MKTWNDIFFASCHRGDDPCYAMFLADEYIKRKRSAMLKELIKAVEELLEANARQRKAEDRYIIMQYAEGFETAADVYQDACATTIICENEVRKILSRLTAARRLAEQEETG